LPENAGKLQPPQIARDRRAVAKKAKRPQTGVKEAHRQQIPQGVFMVTITVNGVRHETQASADTPLIYILRNEMKLSGPQFGCGLSQCGACSVLLNGREIRSCSTPLSLVGDAEVTTLEGLPARWAKQKGLASADAENTLHPIQQAWIEEQTPLCGFCQSGMMIKATELLEHTPQPSVAQIKEAFTTSGPSAHLCRCGSYTAIIEAVQRAATVMTKMG
jgi:isoquinoline 1-oxidoreductase alpha subunit